MIFSLFSLLCEETLLAHIISVYISERGVFQDQVVTKTMCSSNQRPHSRETPYTSHSSGPKSMRILFGSSSVLYALDTEVCDTRYIYSLLYVYRTHIQADDTPLEAVVAREASDGVGRTLNVYKRINR